MHKCLPIVTPTNPFATAVLQLPWGYMDLQALYVRVCCVADALSRCLQLVVQYPFNSMLHHLVTDIITTALAAGPASLLDHLFQHCNLLHWLLTIPVSVTPKPRPDSEG